MKYYGLFYHRRSNPNRWDEAMGDRSVIQLDGRMSRANMMVITADECAKRGYDGYRIARGERLTNLFFLTATVQTREEDTSYV